MTGCDVLVDGGPLAFEWFDAMDTNDGLMCALYFVGPDSPSEGLADGAKGKLGS